MLKSCLPYLGSPDCLDNNDTKSTELEGQGQGQGQDKMNSPSLDCTLELKQILVRVVHAGGKVEHYPNAVIAARVLEKLPAGKWLARPEVFRQPHESIIRAEEYLVPGHKYYVVPLSTIKKLKRKHNKMSGGTQEEMSSDVSAVVEARDYESRESECMDDSFSSARDFYVRKVKKWTSTSNGHARGSSRRGGRMLVPHAKPKPCSGYTWEPGLTSIQELSP